MAATTLPAPRPTSLSRLLGVAYFGIVFTGIFAEFVVRGQLVVTGDAAATAANIASSPGLFATGIGADVVMIALDVIVGLGLFRLLEPHDRRLARIATGARLIQAGILAANMLTLAPALGLAQDAVSTGSSATAAQALQAVEAHALGYDIGLIAFGVSCLALAKLLADHHLVPPWLAIGMAATGAVYLLGSFVALFAPALDTTIDPFYLIAMVVEPAFAARLFRRGIRQSPATVRRPVAVAG